MDWIDFDTTKPQPDKLVLVWVADDINAYDMGCWSPGRDYIDGWLLNETGWRFNKIKYWAELPAPPEN